MNDLSKHGKPGEISPVPIMCEGDIFENAIRAYGVVNACEWFGHSFDSEFTQESIRILIDRSKAASKVEKL